MGSENSSTERTLAWILSSCSPPSREQHQAKRKRVYNMDEETPVPKRGRVGALISLNAQLPAPESASTLSKVTTSSRSSSPTKRKRDLKFTTPEINFYRSRAFKEQRHELEDRIPLLKPLLASVTQAQCELPKALEQFIRQRHGGLGPALPLFSTADYLLPFFDLERKIVNLQQAVEECQKYEVTEEEWSDRVVYPILRAAAKRADQNQQVQIATAKSIDVQPRNLLPLSLRGDSSQRKRVDYTLGVFLPDPRIARSIQGELPGQSFSQSTHSRLADLALFSHLEIKLGSSVTDGEVQLAVWCAAGFKKMAEIKRIMSPKSSTQLPVIPLWYWQEDIVKLQVATVRSPEIIDIFEVMTWSLTNEVEMVKLIITLAFVMRWGTTLFLDEFKKMVRYDEDEDEDGEI